MWEDNCPKKIGIGNFLKKYSGLFPERVEHYASGHWMLTEDLLEHGSKIINRIYTNPNFFYLFLFKVCMWKNPHEKELRKSIADLTQNSISDIKNTFETALNIFWSDVQGKDEIPEQTEHKLVDTFGELQGFGKTTGSRKLVSAIMRFLDPTEYGTVDYRNWGILSNTEHEFFEEAFLKPLASTLRESKNQNIDTDKYIQYLRAIRNLARDYESTPAEVDMALFAYSDEIVPLGAESTTLINKEKAMKMMKIVQEVVDIARRVGYPRSADILSNAIKPLAEKGNYEGIYRTCVNMASNRPDMDEKIARRGGRSLASQLPRIKEIRDHD